MQDFTSETVFKDIEEWDSLLSLSVIAMVDEECDVILSGDDIVKSKTIGDLYIVFRIHIVPLHKDRYLMRNCIPFHFFANNDINSICDPYERMHKDIANNVYGDELKRVKNLSEAGKLELYCATLLN